MLAAGFPILFALSDADQSFTEALWEQAKIFAPRLGIAALVLLAFWVGSALAAELVRRVARRAGPDREQLLELAAQCAKMGLRVFGVITALGTFGVDISALVAGLGLTGFALGFALRDALSNVLAGAMILFYRPFRRGSRISVSGFDGIVADIDLRYTALIADGKRILIPNSNLLTNPITVHHEAPPPGNAPRNPP